MDIQFQGDIMFMRIEKIPETAKEQKRTGVIVVAHSETGHHHTIDADDAVHYEASDDLLTCYLQLESDATVVHNRPWDTHAPITLKSGKWMGRRQREYTPEGWRRVAD